jgi:hypothetical protein
MIEMSGKKEVAAEKTGGRNAKKEYDVTAHEVRAITYRVLAWSRGHARELAENDDDGTGASLKPAHEEIEATKIKRVVKVV